MSDLTDRDRLIGWIVGFVDGEGTFSASIFRNRTASLGWQVFPEFVVTQGCRGINALEEIKAFFKCGNIYINHRVGNHRENVAKYCVRSVRDLNKVIVPFFKTNSLVTSKKSDFETFSMIMDIIDKGQHLDLEGLIRIAKLSESMNRMKSSEFLREIVYARGAYRS